MNAEALVLRRTRALDYLELAKPGIALSVAFTAAVGFVVAGGSGALLAHVALGTLLAAAGANALNMVLEHGADARMVRTRNRPLPAGRLQPVEALFFGILVSSAGMLYLSWTVNPAAGMLAASSLAIYLFVYTPLKTRTTLCTPAGAVTGALPPMIGWVAVRGDLGPGAWALFLILFFWQMPHFLAIAWMHRDDYRRAGFRMLSEDAGATGRQMYLYTVALILASFAPWQLRLAGPAYLAGAAALGLAFLAFAVRFALRPDRARARAAFLFSIVYLVALMTLLIIGG